MNVLGTSANVTAMGLLGTAAVVEDLSILGTSTVVSDMATLAGSGNAPSVTNVTASGTVQFGSLSDGTITITDFVDEDNMASDSAVKIPTQQSVKAYVDSQTSGSLSLIDEDNMATDSATRPPSQQSVKAFAESLTGTNIVATGALNAGTITSGFGNIDTGASTITTTGEIAAGSLDISGNIDVDGTTNLDVVDIDGALTQDGGAVFNETGADADLRIESSGNANMLFVDGGNNKVAIGSTSANGIFDVHGTVSAGANTNQIIQRWRIGSDNVTAEMTYDDDGSNSGTFRGFNFGNVTQHDFMIKTHDQTAIHVHANGQVNMPRQPAVLAYSSSAQNDIATGVVTINLDAEVYDVDGNFNTSNYTFTAPKTGKYMCSGQIVMNDVDTAFQWIYGRFNTSNRIYYMALIDPRIEMSADGTHTWTFSALVDMDTNDTLKLDTRSSAHGAAQNNITAGTATAQETFMTVYLAV